MWIYYIERERREKRIIKSNPKNQTLSKMDCKICQNKTPIRLEDQGTYGFYMFCYKYVNGLKKFFEQNKI